MVKNMFLRLTAFIMAVAGSGCASGPAQRLATYPGPLRPLSQTARVWGQQVTLVDGKFRPPAATLPGKPEVRSEWVMDVLPGHHTVVVTFAGGYAVAALPITVDWDAAAGKEYRVDARMALPQPIPSIVEDAENTPRYRERLRVGEGPKERLPGGPQ